jgi:hypothetical protein
MTPRPWLMPDAHRIRDQEPARAPATHRDTLNRTICTRAYGHRSLFVLRAESAFGADSGATGGELGHCV